MAPGLQSARHHFRIFPRKTAVELGAQRVSQPRKGPQGPRAVGLGLGAAAALGMWVQVQFLPLRLPLRGFQREWPEEPTGETRHSPCHPAPGSVPVSCGHVSDRIPPHPSLNSSPLLTLWVQTALPQPPPLASLAHLSPAPLPLSLCSWPCTLVCPCQEPDVPESKPDGSLPSGLHPFPVSPLHGVKGQAPEFTCA